MASRRCAKKRPSRCRRLIRRQRSGSGLISGQGHSALWVEAVSEAAAVDVEGFEDLQDGFDRDAPGLGPADDVEVFLAGVEAVEEAIEQKAVVVEFFLQKSEVTAVEFNPEAFTL